MTPALTGSLEPAADKLTVTSPLIPDLAVFLGTQAGIETVLLLLLVSLIVIAAAVILLAARMMVARRAGELAMLRARGGSLRQVAALMARGAVVAALPAAVVGAAWPSPRSRVTRRRRGWAGRWPGSRSRSRWPGRR